MALFKQRDRVLGIDIGPSSVKLMELSRNGQRYKVEAMAIEPLPEGAMENRNPTALDEVGAALKSALKTSGTRLKKAAVAVPTSSVITRTIPMPAEFGEDEIEAHIQLDASQYIPFPLEEIYLDFQVVQKSSKVDANTQEVMIVASRKENVDLRKEVLQEAGLKTAIVDVEAYALENTVRFFSREFLKQEENAQINLNKLDGSLTALVDIGADITTLYVLRDDKVIFTREQAFGSEQLTTAIAEFYDLPKDRAELAKRSGDLSEDYPVNILSPFQQAAAEQIGQALQFFFSSDHYAGGRHSQLDRLTLTGGGAMIAGLDSVIAERLNIPAMIGNPFAQMSNMTRVNRHSLLRDAPLFGVACGLALRSFD